MSKRRKSATISAAEAEELLSHLEMHRVLDGLVTAAMPYVVGDRGPETFVPNTKRRVVPLASAIDRGKGPSHG